MRNPQGAKRIYLILYRLVNVPRWLPGWKMNMHESQPRQSLSSQTLCVTEALWRRLPILLIVPSPAASTRIDDLPVHKVSALALLKPQS